MALTQNDIEALKANAEIVNNINVWEFIEKIKAKAENWIKEMTHG